MREMMRFAAEALRVVADRLDPPAAPVAKPPVTYTGTTGSWWMNGKPPTFVSGTWGRTG